MSEVYYCFTEDYNCRLDVFLSQKKSISRSEAIQLIESENVTINKIKINKKSQKIHINDIVEITYKEKISNINSPLIPAIEILFEHKDFLIINKPPFISCHQTNQSDKNYTIADFAHLYWQEENNQKSNYLKNSFNRNGIVHRLDKDTSGLLIITKNQKASTIFFGLFKERKIEKKYVTFTEKNTIPKEETITFNIMRNPLCPVSMTHCLGQGKSAITQYKIINSSNHFLVLECFPKTGRTHQIRVHLAAIKVPILGDAIYGKKTNLINRQALHAKSLSFEYENKFYYFDIPLWQDMQNLYSY